MVKIHTRELLAPIDAARRLGITPKRLQQIAQAGEVTSVTDSIGKRTYCVEHIEALAAVRAKLRPSDRRMRL